MYIHVERFVTYDTICSFPHILEVTCRNDKSRHWFWTPRKKRWDPVSWAKRSEKWSSDGMIFGKFSVGTGFLSNLRGRIDAEWTGCIQSWFGLSFLIQSIGTETNNTKWWFPLEIHLISHLLKLVKLHRNRHVYTCILKTYKQKSYSLYVTITPLCHQSLGWEDITSQLRCSWIERYYCLVCNSVPSHQQLLTRLCIRLIKAGLKKRIDWR